MPRKLALLAVAAIALVLSPAARAQSGVARHAFQLRFGGFFLDGGGELWESNEETFTLDSSDFDGFIFGMTYTGAFNNHLEYGLNVDFYSEDAISAYRGVVDEDLFPIYHDTNLDMLPVSFDLRFLPAGRYRQRPQGREVIRPVFYLGAGAGLNFWEYEEVGDFVDFSLDPPEVFYDRFVDDGQALEAHVLAGVELPTSPHFNFVLEGRYSWAEDDLGGGFAGLGDLDLGGAALYAGAAFRF